VKLITTPSLIFPFGTPPKVPPFVNKIA